LNEFQEYFVEEFVQAYKYGYMSRRDLIRRVLYITGGVASTASLLMLMGCGSSSPAASSAAPAASSMAAKPAASAAASAPASAKPAASAPASASGPAAKSPISVPANDPAVKTRDFTFQGNGIAQMAYEAVPADASGPLALVMVCHQNTGLNEHIRDVTRRFAKAGYMAAALDLLARQGGTAKVDPARVPSLLSSSNTGTARQFVDDFKSLADYYTNQAPTKPSVIGMNGFCFGGTITYRTVEALPTLKAAAPFYGSAPPLDQVQNIKAAILGVYSSDPNDPANRGRDDLDAAMKAANVVHQFNVYPGTRHAFNDDTGAAYNQKQALAAWKDTLDWFGTYLKP
jgi:carboxymethylenebutenolidase